MSDTIHREKDPGELNEIRTTGSSAGSDPHPPSQGPGGAGLPSIDVSPLKKIRANSLVTYGTGEISKRTVPHELTVTPHESGDLVPIQRQNASMFRKVVNMATYIIRGLHKNIRMHGTKLRAISDIEEPESNHRDHPIRLGSPPHASYRVAHRDIETSDEKGVNPDAPRNRSPSSIEDNESVGGESQYDIGNVPDYKDDDKISDKIHCKRMNKLLAEEAGIRHYEDVQMIVVSPGTECWIPPSEPGLANSNVILPDYYFTATNRHSGNRLIKFNYFDIILDDIRNLRKLNAYQLKYIAEKCSNQEKMRVIHEFNGIVSAYITQVQASVSYPPSTKVSEKVTGKHSKTRSQSK